MSSSSLSSSSTTTVCSCSGKLCFCELVSPMTPPPPSSSKKKTTTTAATKETKTPYLIIPGCLCFRCEIIRDGFDDDDGEANFDGEFEDNVTIVDPADIFGIDFERDDIINEVAAEETNEFESLDFLITSLC